MEGKEEGRKRKKCFCCFSFEAEILLAQSSEFVSGIAFVLWFFLYS